MCDCAYFNVNEVLGAELLLCNRLSKASSVHFHFFDFFVLLYFFNHLSFFSFYCGRDDLSFALHLLLREKMTFFCS